MKPLPLVLGLLVGLGTPLVAASYSISPIPSTDAALRSFAAGQYGASSFDIYPAAEVTFNADFTGYSLYLVQDHSRYPPLPHVFAWNPTEARGFDLTTQWNPLLIDAHVVMLNGADAIKYAKAYAQTANAEYQLTRSVVGSADSARLGVAISDPVAVSVLGGWQVTATTWSAENGVLGNWTFNLTSASFTQAAWQVKAIGVGLANVTWEATNFVPGIRLLNDYSGSSYALTVTSDNGTGPQPMRLMVNPSTDAPCTPVTTKTNFDGTTWSACYLDTSGGGIPASVLTAGDALTSAGVAVYAKEVRIANPACGSVVNPAPNLGFTGSDASCVTQIDLLSSRDFGCTACLVFKTPTCPSGGPSCAQGGKIVVNPTFREQLLALGAYTDPVQDTIYSVARPVVGHEFYHLLQFAYLGKNSHWSSLIEGQARFVETLVDGPMAAQASSLFYHPGAAAAQADPFALDTGVQAYLRDPNAPNGFCSYQYAPGLAWAYLYSMDGNLTLLHRALENAAAYDPTFDCNQNLAAALTTTLAGQGGAHATFGAAMDDLSFAMFARNFTWAPVNASAISWGGRLMAPTNTTASATSDNGGSLNYWGRQYWTLPNGTWRVSCSLSSNVVAELLTRGNDGAFGRTTLSCAGLANPSVTVNVGGYAQVAFVAANLNGGAQGTVGMRLTAG